MINRSTGHQPGFSHQLLPMIFHHRPKMAQQWQKSCALRSIEVGLQFLIELDDGKIYRKALYLMVKTNGFP